MLSESDGLLLHADDFVINVVCISLNITINNKATRSTGAGSVLILQARRTLCG